jgi:hypothetical protein
VSKGLTVAEGAAAMQPPMPIRELSRRLKGVAPIGSTFGRRGRRARTYPVADIMRAHADWVREREAAR